MVVGRRCTRFRGRSDYDFAPSSGRNSKLRPPAAASTARSRPRCHLRRMCRCTCDLRAQPTRCGPGRAVCSSTHHLAARCGPGIAPPGPQKRRAVCGHPTCLGARRLGGGATRRGGGRRSRGCGGGGARARGDRVARRAGRGSARRPPGSAPALAAVRDHLIRRATTAGPEWSKTPLGLQQFSLPLPRTLE